MGVPGGNNQVEIIFAIKRPCIDEVSHIPNVHPIEMAERENKGGDYQQSLAPWGRL